LTLESQILSNLVHNEDYATKVIPFLKPEYFSGSDKLVFELIYNHIDKYKKRPSVDILLITLNKTKALETIAKEAEETIKSLTIQADDNLNWLLNTTEEFCQDRAMLNAMSAAIDILQNKDKRHTRESAPELLREALAISFDPRVGHDYLEDAAKRYEAYHDRTLRVPFDLDILNKITNGGLPQKTLSVILAGTNVGKTMIMCHCAASALHLGKNALYVTMEMSEDEIAKRIDANLLNVNLEDIILLPQDMYMTKIHNLQTKTSGKLIVKEYPTGAASCSHFRALLNDLALKKNFKPDIIYIDYIGICASSRIKFTGDSYTYTKWIAEELRGLAVEYEVPVLTAGQFNRAGYKSSDPDLDATAESFGLPFTADFMLGVITSEELDRLNQFMFRQLKTRFGDKRKNKKFVLGVDMAKQRLYEIEATGQVNEGTVAKPTETTSNTERAKKFTKIQI
jgi:replicative DNA helicase